jgi:hypothetical protein
VEEWLVSVLPKKSWLWAIPACPGWTIGSSGALWLTSQRTAKLAPWSEERAEAAGVFAKAERRSRTAVSVATTSAVTPQVAYLRVEDSIMPPSPPDERYSAE